MTDREIFKNNLTNLMQSAKVKQIDIARYAGVSYQTVSAWVQGRGYPRADAMERLCKFFGIRQSALTEEQGTESAEDTLTAIYRSLPQEGKNKLMERADELTKLYLKGGKQK